MPQKVITVTHYPNETSAAPYEVDFPKLTKALEEGYTVKEMKQILMPVGFTGTYYAIVFLLEKNG